MREADLLVHYPENPLSRSVTLKRAVQIVNEAKPAGRFLSGSWYDWCQSKRTFPIAARNGKNISISALNRLLRRRLYVTIYRDEHMSEVGDRESTAGCRIVGRGGSRDKTRRMSGICSIVVVQVFRIVIIVDEVAWSAIKSGA